MWGYGPDYGMMGGFGGGYGPFGMIIWVLFLIAIVAVVIWLVRSLTRSGEHLPPPPRRSPGLDALDDRYARGDDRPRRISAEASRPGRLSLELVPGAAQHEVVRCRSGTVVKRSRISSAALHAALLPGHATEQIHLHSALARPTSSQNVAMPITACSNSAQTSGMALSEPSSG